MAKAIKQSGGGSLSVLKVESEDGKPPKYTTDPKEMDDMITKAQLADEGKDKVPIAAAATIVEAAPVGAANSS